MKKKGTVGSRYCFFILSMFIILAIFSMSLTEAAAIELVVQEPTPIGPAPTQEVKDIGVMPRVLEPQAPPVTGTIEGINFDEDSANNSGFYHIPPDPIGAAGPNHVVSVVNTSIEWHTKAGVQQNSESLASFFAAVAPLTATFDPKVIYDQHQDRFVVVTLEIVEVAEGENPGNVSSIFVAVSDDSDPNGTWYFAAIDAKEVIGGNDHWADYPGFAVDEEAVYITANMFSHVSRISGGTRLWIIDKGVGSGGLYDGGAASVVRYDFPTITGGFALTTQPAHMFGTPPANVGTFLVQYSGLTDGVNEFLGIIRINDPLGTPTFNLQYVPLGDIDLTSTPMPDAPQNGTGTTVETNDRRALHAVWRNDSLWTTAQIVPETGPDAGESTAHWWEVDTSNLDTLSVIQQGDVGGEDIAEGTHTFFPSIAVDKNGNMAIGFAASASTIYPGAYYTGRTATDTAGTVQPSETLAAGLDYYIRTFGGPRNRWGDYSGISVDPADDTTFWVFNQYALTRGTPFGGEDGRWGTRFGSFTFAGGKLAVDFGSMGVFIYDGTAWARINTMDASSLGAYGNKLVANFPGRGLYEYDGSTWQRITTNDTAQTMIGLGSLLYVEFSNGLWEYNGTSFTRLTTSDVSALATFDGKLAVNFPGRGLYVYDGGWSRITNNDTAQVLTGVGAILYVDFLGSGVYSYDGSSFQRINTNNTEEMVAADLP
jgi:hypothetical protein